MKTITSLFYLFLFALLGVSLGGYSVFWVLDKQIFISGLQRGVWISYPDLGSTTANPYLQARSSQQRQLPLGPAEGLTFTAHQDSQGMQLTRQCNYRLIGTVPISRLWTLTPYDETGRVINPDNRAQKAFHSDAIIYNSDFLEINIGPKTMPGNWLTIDGSGPMSLVFRLYDTPITSTISIRDFKMPLLEKQDCK